jgi:hypothetical protein
MALHPGAWESVARSSARAGHFSVLSALVRVLRLVLGWLSFALGNDLVTAALALAALLVVAGLAYEGLIPSARVDRRERSRGRRAGRIVAWARARSSGTTPTPERVVPWVLAVLGGAMALT